MKRRTGESTGIERRAALMRQSERRNPSPEAPKDTRGYSCVTDRLGEEGDMFLRF